MTVTRREILKTFREHRVVLVGGTNVCIERLVRGTWRHVDIEFGDLLLRLNRFEFFLQDLAAALVEERNG